MNNRQPKDHGSRRQADANNCTGDTNVAAPPEERGFAAPSAAGSDERQPGLESKTPEPDNIPVVAHDDPKQHVTDALDRDALTGHLKAALASEAMKLRLELPNSPDPLDPETNKVLDWLLRSTTKERMRALNKGGIVLWNTDLLAMAEGQAEKVTDVRVTAAYTPRRHELWYAYESGGGSSKDDNTHPPFAQVLLPVAAALDDERALAIRSSDVCGEIARHLVDLGALYALTFSYPVVDGVTRLDKPPVVRIFVALTVGLPPQSIEAKRLFACLCFRANALDDDTPANVNYSRPEWRRMEHEDKTPPTVQFVYLRPKER